VVHTATPGSAEIESDDRAHGGALQRAAIGPARAGASPSDGGQTLRLALLLALPVIGVEQLAHTDRLALAALPLYQALHWLSDSLLALPLAAVAVWSGQRLATRLGLRAETPPAIVGRAGLIALLFALVLVPGTALHDTADRLTHVHVLFSSHSHVPLPSRAAPSGAATVARFVTHALSDGFVGQVVGFPLMILMLAWQARKPRLRGVAAPETKEA
jgi:hypothetical protein